MLEVRSIKSITYPIPLSPDPTDPYFSIHHPQPPLSAQGSSEVRLCAVRQDLLPSAPPREPPSDPHRRTALCL